MNFIHLSKTGYLAILFLLSTLCAKAQNTQPGSIKGNVKLDSSWSPKIYLSYIPTFSDIHSMSSEMIVTESAIDPSGNFEFGLDFLSKEFKLFRLHITKKADSKTSLIIGGLNENYLLFIANRTSKINFTTSPSKPPFSRVFFNPKNENLHFQNITDLVKRKDSIASKSGASKRKFIEDRLSEELLNIADSTNNSLVSLYAIYQSDFELNYSSNKKFFTTYLNKWSKVKDSYFNDFRKKLPLKKSKSYTIPLILLALLLLITGFVLGKYGLPRNKRINKLSVQERKIYNSLKNGASNKELSEEFHIGISTVKSHVSSILTKLKVKSRKDIMNLD